MMHHFCKGAAFLGLKTPHCEERRAAHHELREKFAAHMEAEGLSYGTKDEYHFRRAIFEQKDAEINKINNEQDSFRLAHNMFSTMTEAEAKTMLGAKVHETQQEETPLDDTDLADAVDWRAKGAVNAVKNQARCGSCWAFGATATVEAEHQIKTGKLLSLSEQELVSCVTGCYGCQGGW
jgi:cathepsin L